MKKYIKSSRNLSRGCLVRMQLDGYIKYTSSIDTLFDWVFQITQDTLEAAEAADW